MENLNVYVGQCRGTRQIVFDMFTDKPEHLEELHRFAEFHKISRKWFKEDSYFPHYEVIWRCGCKTLRLAACPVDDATQKEFASRWQVIALQNRFE